MKTRPDFSPVMLAGFLQARFESRSKSRRKWLNDLRKRAGITERQMDSALNGRLRQAAARARLWGALGIVPADYGIGLVDGGKQEFVSAHGRTGAGAPGLREGGAKVRRGPSGPVSEKTAKPGGVRAQGLADLVDAKRAMERINDDG